MNHSEGRFTGAEQRSIYFQCWEPETFPKAVLLVVHGAGEHSARYQPLAQFFTEHHYAVAALDHQGHGQSDGIPGYVNAFEDYLFDLATLHTLIEERYAGRPIFLLGHSMGGLIAAIYLTRHQQNLVGGILSGPAILSDLKPGKVQMLLLRLLAVLLPKLGMLKLAAEGVSRDPEVVKRYIEDPLVYHGKMSARMVRELFNGMQQIQEGAARITLPMLMLHGGADVMTSPKGSQFLHQHIGSRDKTLTIYPGLYHEIFNEPEHAGIFLDVFNWCEARLPTA